MHYEKSGVPKAYLIFCICLCNSDLHFTPTVVIATLVYSEIYVLVTQVVTKNQVPQIGT